MLSDTRLQKQFSPRVAEEWLRWAEHRTHYADGDIECDVEDFDEVLIPAVRAALLAFDHRGLCRNCGWRPGDSEFIP